MRRFWTYVGAALPLATAAEHGNAALNPYPDVGETLHSGRDDQAGSDEDAAGAPGDKAARQGKDSGSPAGDAPVSGNSSIGEGGGDAVTQEIRGLLNELDQINSSVEVNSPDPSSVYGPASGGMYAPASTGSGSAGGNGTTISALADTDTAPDVESDIDEDDENEGDESDSGTEPDDSNPSDADDTSGEPDVEDVDSMLVLLGGSAGGADGTTTDGDIDLEVVDYGEVTVAYGKAAFTATSDWDGTGEPPAAYAETFLDVYDADLVFFYHVDDGYGSEADEGAQYTTTSTLYVVAVDFEDDHPLADEFDMSDDNGYEHEYDPGLDLAGYDGTPEGGYFVHPLLDGTPFDAFSQYFGDGSSDVHLDGSGADLTFISTDLDGSEAPVLIGDVTTIEDVASSSDLVAQTDYGQLAISVSAFGPDTYTMIDGQMLGTDEDFSGITGLAIGIA